MRPYYGVFVGLLLLGVVGVVSIIYPFARGKYSSVESKVVELHITLAEEPAEAKKNIERIQPVGNPGFKSTEGKAICSGAFVDDHGTILTAKHCVEGITSMDVVTENGFTYAATYVAKSDLQDLALVRIDRHNTPFFTLADTVKRGEHIFILGSPMGETNTLSQGYIAKLAGDKLVVDASVAPGNSGGPVYDGAGQLVGVAVAVYVSEYGMTHLGVVESTDAVRAFLKLVLEKKHGR